MAQNNKKRKMNSTSNTGYRRLLKKRRAIKVRASRQF